MNKQKIFKYGTIIVAIIILIVTLIGCVIIYKIVSVNHSKTDSNIAENAEENINDIDGDSEIESNLLKPLSENWETDWAIKSGPESATDLMIAAGPDNNLHLVSGDYYNKKRCELRYAFFNGQIWKEEKVPFDSVFIGEEANIAVDSQNIPHIVFNDEVNLAIYHAEKQNSNWDIELVEYPSSFTLNVGIDIDSQDSPHIIYDTCGAGEDYDYPVKPSQGKCAYWYAFKEGNSWKTEIITNEEIQCRSIALDSLDNPHTAFAVESSNGSIHYAYKNNNRWVTENVDNSWMRGSDVDIDVDSQNRPHMIYKSKNNELIYAVKDISWKKEILDADSGQQEGVRISIDTNDIVHIYYSKEEDGLSHDGNIIAKYIYKDTSWKTEDISYGGEGDISVGEDGIVHACFGTSKPDSPEPTEWVRCAHRIK